MNGLVVSCSSYSQASATTTPVGNATISVVGLLLPAQLMTTTETVQALLLVSPVNEYCMRMGWEPCGATMGAELASYVFLIAARLTSRHITTQFTTTRYAPPVHKVLVLLDLPLHSMIRAIFMVSSSTEKLTSLPPFWLGFQPCFLRAQSGGREHLRQV
eukprot:Em0005g298a